MRKKELVKKLNELLKDSNNYNEKTDSYAGAFGYLEKGIELLIEDLENEKKTFNYRRKEF